MIVRAGRAAALVWIPAGEGGTPPATPSGFSRSRRPTAAERVGLALARRDLDQARVDDPALGRAVERVAGREHQRVEAAVSDDAPVVVVHDLVLEDAVAEVPYGISRVIRSPVSMSSM